MRARPNTKNLELVRSLGADDVVGYLQEDFTKRQRPWHVSRVVAAAR